MRREWDTRSAAVLRRTKLLQLVLVVDASDPFRPRTGELEANCGRDDVISIGLSALVQLLTPLLSAGVKE